MILFSLMMGILILWINVNWIDRDIRLLCLLGVRMLWIIGISYGLFIIIIGDVMYLLIRVRIFY